MLGETQLHDVHVRVHPHSRSSEYHLDEDEMGDDPPQRQSRDDSVDFARVKLPSLQSSITSLSSLEDIEAQSGARRRRLLPWLETSFSFLILSFLSILILRSWIYPFFNRELITFLVFLYASIVIAFHAVLARICSNRSELAASMIVVDLFTIPMFVFAAQRAAALW